MDESLIYTSRGGGGAFNASQQPIKNRVATIEHNSMQLTHDLKVSGWIPSRRLQY